MGMHKCEPNCICNGYCSTVEKRILSRQERLERLAYLEVQLYNLEPEYRANLFMGHLDIAVEIHKNIEDIQYELSNLIEWFADGGEERIIDEVC